MFWQIGVVGILLLEGRFNDILHCIVDLHGGSDCRGVLELSDENGHYSVAVVGSDDPAFVPYYLRCTVKKALIDFCWEGVLVAINKCCGVCKVGVEHCTRQLYRIVTK